MSTDEKKKKMKVLSRDDILGAKDMEVREVEVLEWGGVVRLKTLSGRERDEWEKQMMTRKGGPRDIKGMRPLIIAFTAVNEEGNALFTFKDVEALNRKASKPIDELAEVAMEMNGLTDRNIEEAVKNLLSGQSENSGSK